MIEQVYPSKVKGPRPPSTLTAPPPPPAPHDPAQGYVRHHPRGRSAGPCSGRRSAPTASSSSSTRSATSCRSTSRCSSFTAAPRQRTTSALRGAVALGAERTLEQDATFAFRVIVDIAIKALSARRSTTRRRRCWRSTSFTACCAQSGGGTCTTTCINDANGKPRVIFRTPNWDDFVELSCREIRLYGAENYQIARRLRAMLENLAATLPENRRPGAAQGARAARPGARSAETAARRSRARPHARPAGPGRADAPAARPFGSLARAYFVRLKSARPIIL